MVRQSPPFEGEARVKVGSSDRIALFVHALNWFRFDLTCFHFYNSTP